MTEEGDLYYVLQSDVSKKTVSFWNEPELPDGADMWIDGKALTVDVPRPLVYEVEPGDEGDMPAFINTAIPLMSEPLVQVLRKCGVDNLEVFDVVINELATGKQHTNYRAVNVLGMVDAVDHGKTKVESIEGLANWVSNMALDEKATRGALMFRLAQLPSKIILHRRVKQAIEAQQLPLVYFVETTGLSG